MTHEEREERVIKKRDTDEDTDIKHLKENPKEKSDAVEEDAVEQDAVEQDAVEECGLCLDTKKEKSDFDVKCVQCKFYVCYECMFEYIKFNRKKNVLLCPHCRQDLFDQAIENLIESNENKNENVLIMHLLKQRIYKYDSDSSDNSDTTNSDTTDSDMDSDTTTDSSDYSTDDSQDSNSSNYSSYSNSSTNTSLDTN